MAPRMVTAPDPAAVPRAGRSPTCTAPGLSPAPSLHAPQTRRPSGDSSDAALAAGAPGPWCEKGPPGAPAGAGGKEARAADLGRAQLVTCGLWLAQRRLVAVVLGPRGDARRAIRAALTDDARFGLLEYLAAAGADLVATEALARVDLTPVQAARRGLSVWTAGDALVAALLGAAAIRDPARAAALLARLPAIPLLRSAIRRLAPPDRRQLPLL